MTCAKLAPILLHATRIWTLFHQSAKPRFATRLPAARVVSVSLSAHTISAGATVRVVGWLACAGCGVSHHLAEHEFAATMLWRRAQNCLADCEWQLYLLQYLLLACGEDPESADLPETAITNFETVPFLRTP